MAINRKRADRAYGLTNALQDLAPEPIKAQRAPTSSDIAIPGTVWLDQSAGGRDVYILLDTAGGSTWSPVGAENPTFEGLITATAGFNQTAGPFNVLSDTPTATAITLANTDVAGGIEITAQVGGLTLVADLGQVLIESTEDNAESVHIHTNGGPLETIFIESSLGISNTSINLFSVAGGITIDGSTTGNISLVPGTNSVAGVALTLNSKIGAALFTGQTTAAAATETFTITNSEVSLSSSIIVTVSNIGSNDALMALERVKPAAGSFEVFTQNNGAAALNGNVVISWIVLN